MWQKKKGSISTSMLSATICANKIMSVLYISSIQVLLSRLSNNTKDESQQVNGSEVTCLCCLCQEKPWPWLSITTQCRAQRSSMLQTTMPRGWPMAGNIVRCVSNKCFKYCGGTLSIFRKVILGPISDSVLWRVGGESLHSAVEKYWGLSRLGFFTTVWETGTVHRTMWENYSLTINW